MRSLPSLVASACDQRRCFVGRSNDEWIETVATENHIIEADDGIDQSTLRAIAQCSARPDTGSAGSSTPRIEQWRGKKADDGGNDLELSQRHKGANAFILLLAITMTGDVRRYGLFT